MIIILSFRLHLLSKSFTIYFTIMAKVLVIRKTDKTIHKVALQNKAALMSYSNRLPLANRWKFEEMEEEEAEKLPFIDDSYVTAGEAQSKVKELEAINDDKDNKIKELEARLAALDAGAKAPPILPIEPAKTSEEPAKKGK